MLVSRRRLERAVRLGSARERAIAGVAVTLARAARTSVEAVRDEISRALREAVPAVDGALFYEEHEGALRCVTAFGERFAYFAGSCVSHDDESSMSARAFATGHRVTLEDAGVRALHPGDVAAVAVPLRLDSDRLCTLVAAAQVPLSEDDVDRLVMLADLAAPAYAIALDREQDRRRAEYDGLTGLLTPRAFRRRLSALVDRARFEPANRHTLVFADTDHFKRWNDTYGHAAGDALLRELAQLLRGFVSSERDLVARNGGDEFCLVFAETDKAAAIERAEALRRSIAAIDLTPLRPAAADAGVRITASMGIAAFPADARTASDLLERADAAMYHSKETGRDAVSYVAPDGTLTRHAAT